MNLVAQFELTQFKRLNCNLLIFKMSSEMYDEVKRLIMAEGNSMRSRLKMKKVILGKIKGNRHLFSY